jgi:hypothetical protein
MPAPVEQSIVFMLATPAQRQMPGPFEQSILFRLAALLCAVPAQSLQNGLDPRRGLFLNYTP